MSTRDIFRMAAMFWCVRMDINRVPVTEVESILRTINFWNFPPLRPDINGDVFVIPSISVRVSGGL